MTYNAIDVARWIVCEAGRQHIPVTPLQLQKILYYCQGRYIGMTGKPLFSDDIVAWKFGPVVESVYQEFKKYGRGAISPENVSIPKEFETYISRTVRDKAALTAWELVRNTHNEPPYRECCQGDVISVESMRQYFVPEMYGPDEEDMFTPAYTEEEIAQKIRENFTDEELNDLLSAF